MKEDVELLILDTVKKHRSIMPLFKAGYSYSKVMEWGKQLERMGELSYNEDGMRSITEFGEQRLKSLKERKSNFSILPLKGYKIPNLNIDDIYLP